MGVAFGVVTLLLSFFGGDDFTTPKQHPLPPSEAGGPAALAITITIFHWHSTGPHSTSLVQSK